MISAAGNTHRCILYKQSRVFVQQRFRFLTRTLLEATLRKNGECMIKSEKRMWQINIENAAAAVAELYGNEVVKSVFRRYDALELYDLSPCYYGEVFSDLEFMVNDN